MFSTPPPHRVQTRSITRAAQEAEPSALLPTNADTTFVAGSSQMDIQQPSSRDDGVPHPLPPHSKSPSVSTSASAKRKRLELEAAKQKAKIQLELIDKQLEADLADLESENYSPRNVSRAPSVSHVEEWLQEQQLDEKSVHERVNITDSLRPPAAVAANPPDTVQMLASALKDLAAVAMSNGSNNRLLSRLSTSKDLPNFSGDPMEWIYFKQAYEESTDVCGFSPKENLWRLRKCLTGPARDAVSALLACATSPNVIMSTLALRFGNPDVIVHRVMQNVMKLAPVSSEYHKDTVAFSVSVQNFIAAVRAVGREEYLQGMHMSTIFLSKLPPLLISKWSDYSFALINEGKLSRLDILSQFLNEEALKISTTVNILTLPTSTTQNHNAHRPDAVQVQSAAKEGSNCLFCKRSQHDLPTCKILKRALRIDRWRYVKRHGLCFRCLLNRHDSEACPAPVCDKEGCGGAHHRLLHYEVNGNVRRPDNVGASTLIMPEPLPVVGPIPDVEPSPAAEPTPSSSEQTSPHAMLNICESPDGDPVANLNAIRDLNKQERHTFAVEALGDSRKHRLNASNVRAPEMLEKTAVLADDRWNVGLPWINPHYRLPNSFPSAFKRLQGVEKKMIANKDYAHRFKERFRVNVDGFSTATGVLPRSEARVAPAPTRDEC